jgi:hypothetical protein
MASVTWIRCSHCGYRSQKGDLNCNRCGKPIEADKPYQHTIRIPDSYELYGVAIKGTVVEFRFAILKGLVELRNQSTRTYALLHPEAFPILKPIKYNQ